MGAVTDWAGRRWARRHEEPDEPRGEAELLARVAYDLSARGDDAAAIPVYRELLDLPRAAPHLRGWAACRLGWVLLNRYPDDPVPDESRHALATALSEIPREWTTLRLKAFVLAHDGAGAESLRAAAEARRRAPRDVRVIECQLRLIEAIAHASLGRSDESVRLRAEVAKVWPASDLLPLVDAAIAAART